MRRKLLRKGYEDAEVDSALERLGRLGYLDDDRLAAAEAERLRQRKSLGRAGVASELRRKGADGAAVDAAIAGDDAESELARALDAGRRWLGRGRRDAAGLGRFLARKGYSVSMVYRVLHELVPEGEVTESGE